MSNNAVGKEQRVVVQAVQWSALTRIEDHMPICDADYDVLKDLRDVLVRHGYQNRFGVCLLHKHFELGPGEVALEETDEVARTSTTRVVAAAACPQALETAWQFSANNEDIRSGRNCNVKCQGRGMIGHSRYHECIPV